MELGKDYWHEARITIQNMFKSTGDSSIVNDQDSINACTFDY